MKLKVNRERIEDLHNQMQKQREYDKVWTTEFVYEGPRVYLKTVKRK